MKYVIGNWKMYPRDITSAKELILGVAKTSRAAKKKVVSVVCPPMPYLSSLALNKTLNAVSFGAQQVSITPEGAETGEVSPAHLLSSGASYIILGHSECRTRGEQDSIIAEKAKISAKAGLTVILCVGERVRDENGKSFVEVAAQLRSSLASFPEQKLEKLMIAYEPLWAIGEHAESAATPRDFEEMAMLMRRTLSELFPKAKAFRIPFLYGGSVEGKNISSFLKAGAAGVLVGRASLKIKEFCSLIESAAAFENNQEAI